MREKFQFFNFVLAKDENLYFSQLIFLHFPSCPIDENILNVKMWFWCLNEKNVPLVVRMSVICWICNNAYRCGIAKFLFLIIFLLSTPAVIFFTTYSLSSISFVTIFCKIKFINKRRRRTWKWMWGERKWKLICEMRLRGIE
jgi:hypothetical protein